MSAGAQLVAPATSSRTVHLDISGDEPSLGPSLRDMEREREKRARDRQRSGTGEEIGVGRKEKLQHRHIRGKASASGERSEEEGAFVGVFSFH